jgi:hypothetical protein
MLVLVPMGVVIVSMMIMAMPMLAPMIVGVVIVRMTVCVIGMIMRVIVPMMPVIVVAVVVVVMPVAVAVVVPAIVLVGAALRLEGAHHDGGRAALAAHHLGQHVVVLDVDRVRRHLGGGVPVADVVGHLQEPQRVLGAHLQQALGRGLHLHEAAVLELHGIAVVQHRGLVEIEQEIEAGIAPERDAAAVAALVIEGDGVGNPVRFHGGFAEDRGGAEHGEFLQNRK